ncbi:MAG: Glutamate decarboxylase beta [bacterium ADurb.Bin236]|nr:MAG: Glutamate decarboxylase beta [bacterium ADurb.Bin236]
MKELKLPKEGTPRKLLFEKMNEMKSGDADWRNGRMFSLIYNAGDTVLEVAKEAYAMYFAENGLSPFAFPSLKKMETEVIAMTAGLLGGDAKTVGSLTCGGSESILMAVKTARDYAREKRPGVTAPELLAPSTAHPAWDKACHYLGLKPVRVPVGADFGADVEAMKSAANENTILMVASAPTYPHGVVDSISELGEIAQERGIWLHVDACLGGLILPFVSKLGYEVPAFDFSVPGVTSMSADLHKYGFCPKGCSAVLYRDSERRKKQYFAHADFPGGVYGTSTLSGARPGGAIAAAWAVMNFLGENGYMKLADIAMKTTRKLIEEINAMPDMKVLGSPSASVFAFASDTVNVYALSDALKEKNWLVEKQQLPASLHMTVSPFHSVVADAFMADLAASVEEVRGIDAKKLSQEAVMYGVMATLPDRSTAKEFAINYLNQIYTLE